MLPAESHDEIRKEHGEKMLHNLNSRPSIKLAFLIQVLTALKITLKEWRKTAVYFDELLDGTNTSLSPDEHDTLLFEDSTFRRSRKYFWAIDALSNLSERITELIQTWNEYKNSDLPSSPSSSSRSEIQVIKALINFAGREIIEVNSVKDRFKSYLERTKLLRDGV